jgi:hypothetical protein
VAPFLKEQGYTFPVLPAYSLVDQLLDESIGIPQNWVLDPKGPWRWTQMGYNASDTNWATAMLEKLESTRN